MKRWRDTGIGAIVAAIIFVAVEGIIGNQADDIFVRLARLVAGSIHVNTWPWIVTGIVTLAFFILCFYFWQHQKVLEVVQKRFVKMTELDSSLLRHLANWEPPPDRTGEVIKILNEVLRDVAAEFEENPGEENPGGNHPRAAILLPDGEYLKCVASHRMPVETIEEMVFYIGNDPRRRDRGIAGHVYHTEKLLVAHMTQVAERKKWICKDSDKYITFKEMNNPSPPYKSLVSVPISGPDPDRKGQTKSIGILCLDSLSETIFDSKEAGVILLELASRISAAILISEKLPARTGQDKKEDAIR